MCSEEIGEIDALASETNPHSNLKTVPTKCDSGSVKLRIVGAIKTIPGIDSHCVAYGIRDTEYHLMDECQIILLQLDEILHKTRAVDLKSPAA